MRECGGGVFLMARSYFHRSYITKINRNDPAELSILARDSEFGRFDSLDVYRSSDVYSIGTFTKGLNVFLNWVIR